MTWLRPLAGFQLPAMGLGCMGMSEFYGPSDDEQSLRTLRAAYDRGVRHFDTADTYGSGHNETLLGRFLAGLAPGERAGVCVATKFGIRRTPGTYERNIDNSPDYVKSACEASLRRLGLDCLPLFYVHRRDPAVPIEALMESLVALKTAGKIAAIGLSEVSADTLRRAHAVHPVAALQNEYSLWERGAEAEMLPLCQALGVAFVAYSPLGRALLSAELPPTEELDAKDFRRQLPRFSGEAGAHNRALVAEFSSLAEGWQMKPAQVALAWILSRQPHAHVIPGMRRETHLQANWDGARRTLDAAQLARLDALFAPEAVQGARYTPQGYVGIESPQR